ncbi:hypothetical protein LTR08_004608 [Meristemomyces frigidus]|nr:hypothetical protein LTR08_004608 [Meristemomyces frigidus]
MSLADHVLLKRRAATTTEAFRKHYTERHSRLVMPWCLANGVTYYAQLHGPLAWASPASPKSTSDIEIGDWDAVAEMVFPNGKIGGVGMAYYENIILLDERVFLLRNALDHMKVVEPRSVTGERVEFIIDSKAVVGGWEEWQSLWDEYLAKGDSCTSDTMEPLTR